jgi:hypothetical protein
MARSGILSAQAEIPVASTGAYRAPARVFVALLVEPPRERDRRVLRAVRLVIVPCPACVRELRR